MLQNTNMPTISFFVPASHCLIITESEGTHLVVKSDEIFSDCFCLIVSMPLPECLAKFLSD